MALVEDVLGRLGPLARARSVTLSLGSMEPMEMRGDLVHLRRLLFNLVDNAIKYTPEGGTVRVSVERRGEWAMLAVEDTGIGVAHEEQHKVFQRFYRSAEARSGARGLGSGSGHREIDCRGSRRKGGDRERSRKRKYLQGLSAPGVKVIPSTRSEGCSGAPVSPISSPLSSASLRRADSVSGRSPG